MITIDEIGAQLTNKVYSLETLAALERPLVVYGSGRVSVTEHRYKTRRDQVIRAGVNPDS